jgi:hypothetical protein
LRAPRGESFHFAHRYKSETLKESIRRHEHFLALKMGINKSHKARTRAATARSLVAALSLSFVRSSRAVCVCCATRGAAPAAPGGGCAHACAAAPQ